MPVYTQQIADTINLYKVLECPFCSYSSPTVKYKSQMLSHIKKCDNYEQTDDNIEDNVYGEEDETIGYYLDWRVNLINIVKKFIRTNELALINTQTPEQLRAYIKSKLLENMTTDRRIYLDTFWIYTKFFEMNDIERQKYDDVIKEYYEHIFNWATQADQLAST